jgi:hypothetical protein
MIKNACVLATVVALSLATSAVVSAAPERSVQIRVVDASGAPVANARVLIGADEKDAVGVTGADGIVRTTTTSSSLQIQAESAGRKVATTSASSTITVRLPAGGQ